MGAVAVLALHCLDLDFRGLVLLVLVELVVRHVAQELHFVVR